MDSFKKIKLEYKGIRDTILEYTSQGSIVNFLNELEETMKRRDMEGMSYCTQEICKWYMDNIDKIHDNQFVADVSIHDRNKKILEELNQEFIKSKKIIIEEENNLYLKIFLSHSSYDIKYGNALRKLFINMGIKNEQLIYTSHPLNKVPTGKNIFEYLKNNIRKDIFVVYLWSNEYLKSAACLNEMGAAWIVESDYINMYIPDFDFNNQQYQNCAVDTKKMGIILKNDEACKMGLVELKNQLFKKFELNINEQEFIYHIDEFMKEIE